MHPAAVPKDIRYRFDLAGGATMDTGCYAIHMNRSVAAAEPAVARRRGARTARTGVDRWMRAEVSRSTTGSRPADHLRALVGDAAEAPSVRVSGDQGEMSVLRREANRSATTWVDRPRAEPGQPGSDVREGRPTATSSRPSQITPPPPPHAVLHGGPVLTIRIKMANIRVIDAVYDAAGLTRRGDQAAAGGER